MISTRRLLLFIKKHPYCSYLDIATKFFDGDIEITSSELFRIKEFIVGKPKYHLYDDGGTTSTLTDIYINTSGMQYLETIFKDKWRFIIPLVVSVLSLLISFYSCIC